jgi:outer membrane lipoprotein-sorting protein
MSKHLLQSALFIGLLVFASQAQASGFPEPQEDYSADILMTVTNEQGKTSMTGKVFSTKNMERREIQIGQQETVSITDRVAQKTTVLLPAQKSYMDSWHLHDGMRDDDPARSWYRSNVRMTFVSDETINGVETKKYRIYLSDPTGEISAGTLWLSSKDIPIRMQGTTTANGRMTEFQIDHTNVKLTRQSTALFVVPNDFRRIDVAAPMPFLPAPKVIPEYSTEKVEPEEPSTLDQQIEELHRQIPR